MGHGDGVFPSPRPSWSVACEQRLRLRCPLSPASLLPHLTGDRGRPPRAALLPGCFSRAPGRAHALALPTDQPRLKKAGTGFLRQPPFFL